MDFLFLFFYILFLSLKLFSWETKALKMNTNVVENRNGRKSQMREKLLTQVPPLDFSHHGRPARIFSYTLNGGENMADHGEKPKVEKGWNPEGSRSRST